MQNHTKTQQKTHTHTLRHFGVVFAVILGFFAYSDVFAQTEGGVRVQSMNSAQIVREINTARIQMGLSPLEVNAGLNRAAQAKAGDMVQRGYFSHADPSGAAPWQWIESVGYEYSHAGENLAIGFIEAKKQHAAWMNSEFHRENILNAQYTQTGIGVAAGDIRGESEIVVVQFFARPAMVGALRPQSTQQKTNAYTNAAQNVPASVPYVQKAVVAEGSMGEFSRVLGEFAQKDLFVNTPDQMIERTIATYEAIRTQELWRIAVWALLVAQFAVSVAVTAHVYVRGREARHPVDFHGALR